MTLQQVDCAHALRLAYEVEKHVDGDEQPLNMTVEFGPASTKAWTGVWSSSMSDEAQVDAADERFARSPPPSAAPSSCLMLLSPICRCTRYDRTRQTRHTARRSWTATMFASSAAQLRVHWLAPSRLEPWHPFHEWGQLLCLTESALAVNIDVVRVTDIQQIGQESMGTLTSRKGMGIKLDIAEIMHLAADQDCH